MPAVSSETGNQQINQVWKSFAADPRDSSKLNMLASELHALLWGRLPNRSLRGILAGKEPEIRQDALLLLVNRYLFGNRRLIHATHGGDYDLVESQLLRSVSAALKYSLRRHRHLRAEESKRWVQLSDDKAEFGSLPHRSELPLHSLPYPVLLELALETLKLAVEQRLLSPESAGITETMLKEGLSQAKMARRMGCSRAALNQRLAPVRRHLKTTLNQQEIPSV